MEKLFLFHGYKLRPWLDTSKLALGSLMLPLLFPNKARRKRAEQIEPVPAGDTSTAPHQHHGR
jgi:hypothetical protein